MGNANRKSRTGWSENCSRRRARSAPPRATEISAEMLRSNDEREPREPTRSGPRHDRQRPPQPVSGTPGDEPGGTLSTGFRCRVAATGLDNNDELDETRDSEQSLRILLGLLQRFDVKTTGSVGTTRWKLASQSEIRPALTASCDYPRDSRVTNHRR